MKVVILFAVMISFLVRVDPLVLRTGDDGKIYGAFWGK